MIPKPFATPRTPHAPTPWRNLWGKGVVICHLRFLKDLSERRRGISPSCPPDVFQPVPLYLVRPPPSWLSILVVFLFAVRLFFSAGGLSLSLSFIFLVLWSSGLPVCWPAALIYEIYSNDRGIGGKKLAEMKLQTELHPRWLCTSMELKFHPSLFRNYLSET